MPNRQATDHFVLRVRNEPLWSRQTVLTVVGILLLALGVRSILFFGGIRGSDAYLYSKCAHAISIGQYAPLEITQGIGLPDNHLSRQELINGIAPALAALRFTILLPTALSYCLFGVGDISSSLCTIASSLLTIFIIFLLGLFVIDIKTGFLAALLTALYPLDICCASMLGPDSFLPLLTGGAYLLLLRAVTSHHERSHRQNQLLTIMGAGFFVGLSAMARETGILLLVPMGIFLLFKGRWRYGFPLALGAVIPLIVEGCFLWLTTGTFLSFQRQPATFSIRGRSRHIR